MKKLTKKKKEKIKLIASLFIIAVILLFKPVLDIMYFSDYYINNCDYRKINGVIFSQSERTIHTKSVTMHRTYSVFRYVVKGKVYYHKSHIWSGSKELKLNNKEFIYYKVDNPNKAYSKFELDNKFRNLVYVVSMLVVYFLFIMILLLPDILKKK